MSTFTRFRSAVARWKKRLLLDSWEIRTKDGEVEGGGYACCSAQPEYLRATITLDSRAMQDKERSLDELATHELMHAHVWELAHYAESWAGDDAGRKEAVRRAEERLTSTVTAILMKAYRVKL